MQFSETLRARKSVRYFGDKPVDAALVTEIVADAALAPSWVNAQEWKVVVLTGDALETYRKAHAEKDLAGIKGYSETKAAHREQYSAMAQENMATFTQRRIDAGLADIKENSQAYLFHAPVVLFMTVPKTRGDFTILDLGGFCQTLMLAAADRGVASIIAYNLVKYPDLIRQYTAIPEDDEIVIGIALGYEVEHPLNAFRSTRRDVADILRFVS
ncbi:MAG TPA: nitroreductase [Sutterella sp.]|nr:nitroreductase [Sutterella sp.]